MPNPSNTEHVSSEHVKIPTVRSHMAFVLGSALLLMVVLSLLRLALLIYNRDMILDTSASVVLEGFANGLRFDLRLTTYLLIPLLLALFSARAMAARGVMRAWLLVTTSVVIFLGCLELDFYKEFHQRLNGLVFQYIKEDPKTVLSMIWYGYPVVQYLVAWGVGTLGLHWLLLRLDRMTWRARQPAAGQALVVGWSARMAVLLCCVVVATLAIRGTLRQGPPMRWGDAYTTDSLFVNQLGVNGTLSLVDAARQYMGEDRDRIWKSTLPTEQAHQIVREMLLTAQDTLVDADKAPVRRDTQPVADGTLNVRNVVVILLESFAGHSVGALGAKQSVTPYFDELAKEGLLFKRFLSNGTHTHQGMFATMACFPNLPGFEYLMQTPEGAHKLSGLPAVLQSRNYDDVYVYNGDFAWDNQSGFFGNQGMTTFIGRNDFVNPVFSDPTWGVSDQDMFDRALIELKKREGKEPFYALLQTLSNHTPYALPTPLPVEPVTNRGGLNEHLTAMRYSDWALGQFFEKARKEPYFNDTLFVVLGDHGFGNEQQITGMDLGRFNVPLLLIAPGVQDKFGRETTVIGSQVDVVPTIMGRLGGEYRQQCWGRDLLNLPEGDQGFAIFKPSGSDQTVAMIKGDQMLIQPKGMKEQAWSYQFGSEPKGAQIEVSDQTLSLKKQLEAYVQSATESLLSDSAGIKASE